MPEPGMHANGEDQKPDKDNSDQELEIGYNPSFERQWWHLELGLWVFLIVVLIGGLAGYMGEGPAACKEIASFDGGITMHYQQIARFKTPSAATVRLGPQAFHGAIAYIWLSRSFTHDLGLERVVPQPLRSIPDANGIGYEFAVANPAAPIVVDFALQPHRVGFIREELRTNTQHALFAESLVLP